MTHLHISCALLLAACGADPDATARPADDPGPDARRGSELPPEPCAPPEDAEVTAVAVRLVGNPLDQLETVNQGGEVVTRDGACETAHCLRIGPGAMDELADSLRSLLPVDHVRAPDHVSPHYELRVLSVRWEGGQCSAADSAEWHVAAEDMRDFDQAFRLVRDAYAGPPRDP